MVYLLMLIYPIGFLLALTFFKFFGKKLMGVDYDSIPDEDKWPDDYDSNAEAYVAFSAAWFIILPLMLAVGCAQIVMKFGKWFINL